MEDFLVTVEEDNSELQGVPITSPIGPSQSVPKKQSKDFSLWL